MNALRMLLVMTVLTGVVYPLFVTALATTCWPDKARGSIVDAGGKMQGSALLAQAFVEPRYFWPRPSACGYATIASGAGNKGPTSRDLQQTVTEREAAIRLAMAPYTSPSAHEAIPRDLLHASGSGLDPHISPKAALLQIPRVASVRGLPEEVVRRIVDNRIEGPQFGVFGEPRVNVFLLNIELDSILVESQVQKE